ncbi:DUF2480 family protein [Luteirhabdus pelagi]|uniref:DUF2480 family protein n=1 Tax=Luteirhabdus pelagi TaxID=2792783 RepID=UPI00193AB83F|nr:DUF2480 family protein [Luteirhabdus pelagi]
MENEIINRVANSKLVTFDLEEFYPAGERVTVDISQWLLEGIVLKEKDFRTAIRDFNWEQYQNSFIALHCSTDAIVPGWAYMFVALEASKVAKKVVVGSLEELESQLFTEIINGMDLSEFQDKPVIIKGCSRKPVPQSAFVLLAQKLQPVARSIMYGEACSAVPLFKRKK